LVNWRKISITPGAGILSVTAWFRQPSWNLVEIRRKVLGVEHAIKYFSFWDVPRTFAFERGGDLYVLQSEFDDDLDEYPDDYEVFVVPGFGNLSVVSDWKSIEPLPKTSVGRVPVASVRFDESRRKYVDGSFLDATRRPEIK
jgi:hypothetical protein